MTTKDLRRHRHWLKQGKTKGATHMIVVTEDDGGGDDYPVYVKSGEDVRAVGRAYHAPGQSLTSVIAVYSYAKDLEEQLNTASSVFNLD